MEAPPEDVSSTRPVASGSGFTLAYREAGPCLDSCLAEDDERGLLPADDLHDVQDSAEEGQDKPGRGDPDACDLEPE